MGHKCLPILEEDSLGTPVVLEMSHKKSPLEHRCPVLRKETTL